MLRVYKSDVTAFAHCVGMYVVCRELTYVIYVVCVCIYLLV